MFCNPTRILLQLALIFFSTPQLYVTKFSLQGT